LGFFLLIAPLSLLSYDANDSTEDIIQNLGSSYSWYGILDYKESHLEVLDKKQYLSSIDNFSPDEELRFTLDEYKKYLEGSSDFFCRHPSRAFFITHHIKSLPKFNYQNCKEYLRWVEDGDITSISFMYVTGYLQNPASFFGHTLLKFNRGNINQSLLDRSLNYGAETNNDAALPYVVKGLIGKYKAALQEESFFRLSAEYQEFQMRDIYEYKLSFTDYQKNIILSYTYEMQFRKYDYYFLSDNCAYRINRILGNALGEEVMPKTPWKAPIDLLIKIYDSGLVTDIIYHPSQTTKMISGIESLSSEDKILFYSTFNNKLSKYQNFEKLESTSVKLAAIEYLNYKKLKAYKKNDEVILEDIDRARKNILLSINPEKTFKKNEISMAAFPHEINRPTRVSYNSLHIERMKVAHSFKLRGANFELLDKDKTKITRSEFVFLSPKITYFDNELFIDELVLFKILSLNDRKIKIPNERNISWGIDISRKNLSKSCYPCSISSLTGTIGKSIYFNDNSTFYALLDGSMHQSKKNSGNISNKIQTGFLVDIKKTKINLGFEKNKFEKNDKFNENSVFLDIKFNINRDYDFSIMHVNSNKTSYSSIAINKYF
tara:strand:- start:624 stop:2435 length:1812 start_codon:yes stop_codon:yes gene_type:complete